MCARSLLLFAGMEKEPEPPTKSVKELLAELAKTNKAMADQLTKQVEKEKDDAVRAKEQELRCFKRREAG